MQRIIILTRPKIILMQHPVHKSNQNPLTNRYRLKSLQIKHKKYPPYLNNLTIKKLQIKKIAIICIAITKI
jgi:hypothetical protein